MRNLPKVTRVVNSRMGFKPKSTQLCKGKEKLLSARRARVAQLSNPGLSPCIPQ